MARGALSQNSLKQTEYQTKMEKKHKCLHKYKSETIFDQNNQNAIESILDYFQFKVPCEFYFTLFLTLLYIIFDFLYLGDYLLQISNTQLKLLQKREKHNTLASLCQITGFIAGANCQILILLLIFLTFPLNQIKFLTMAVYILQCKFWIQGMKILYHSPRPYFFEPSIALSCELGFGKPSEHSYFPLLCMMIYYYENQIYQKEKEILVDKCNFIVDDSLKQQNFSDRYYLLAFAILAIHCFICWTRFYMGMQSIDSIVLGSILAISSAFLYFFGLRELIFQIIQYLSDYFITKYKIKNEFDIFIKDHKISQAIEKFDLDTKINELSYQKFNIKFDQFIKDQHIEKYVDQFIKKYINENQQLSRQYYVNSDRNQNTKLQDYFKSYQMYNKKKDGTISIDLYNQYYCDYEDSQRRTEEYSQQGCIQIVFVLILLIILIPGSITLIYVFNHQNRFSNHIIKSQQICYSKNLGINHGYKYFLRNGLISQSYVNLYYSVFCFIMFLGVFIRAKLESYFQIDSIIYFIKTKYDYEKQPEFTPNSNLGASTISSANINKYQRQNLDKVRYKKSIEWKNYLKMLLVFIICELIFLVPINGILIPLNLYLTASKMIIQPVIFSFYHCLINLTVFFVVYFSLFEIVVGGIYTDLDSKDDNEIWSIFCLGKLASTICDTLYFARSSEMEPDFIPQNRYFSCSKQQIHFEALQMVHNEDMNYENLVRENNC